jgi:diphosphomevalonate decarboxylase
VNPTGAPFAVNHSDTNRSSDAQPVRAIAHANFALVKYWGKRDPALNLPDVGSISITLDALYADTCVSVDADLDDDAFELDGKAEAAGERRVRALLERVRTLSGRRAPARVVSRNNFPTGAGLASSAAGFAALVTAAARAYGLDLSAPRLSELARIGSGSAARSIFGGFVEMARGERADGRDAVATELAPADHWPLEVAVAISDTGRKAVGSTEGMQRTADTSPFYPAWVAHQPIDLSAARNAIRARDFDALARVSEASALAMHGLAMSARPGLLYFNAATIECLHRVRELRGSGTAVFFTVDAGPQVKAVCESAAAGAVADALADVGGVSEVLRSGLGGGARLVDNA